MPVDLRSPARDRKQREAAFPEVKSTDGRKLLLGDKPTLVTGQGKAQRTKEIELQSRSYAFGFVPGALVEIHKGSKGIGGCAGDGPYKMEVTAFTTP
ncbi:MAG: hypothetical protein JWO36_3297 [Myxococcales bacterium]|nr:hypothetical protein [Myxococcales bacterium]